MADGDMTLKIDEALAVRLKTMADRVGESVEDYARHALESFADPYDPSHLADLERIAQETLDNGTGIPWEEVEPWVRGWGKPDGPPRPR